MKIDKITVPISVTLISRSVMFSLLFLLLSITLISVANSGDVETTPLKVLEGHTDRILSIAFSPDGKTLASGSEDETIRLWDVNTGKEIKTLEGQNKAVVSIAFNSDGKTLMSASEDGVVKLWDATTGNNLKTLNIRDVGRLTTFSPGLKYLASSYGTTINVWDVASGKLIKTFKERNGSVEALVFSPDGKYLASGSYFEIKIWDIAIGKIIKTFKGYFYGAVKSVVFSRDGKYLIAGSDNSEVTFQDATVWDAAIWNVDTGKLVKSFKGNNTYEAVLSSVAFSSDGKLAYDSYSSEKDEMIKLWDINSGKLVKTFKERDGSVETLVFSPDGKYLASGGVSSKIIIWDTRIKNSKR